MGGSSWKRFYRERRHHYKAQYPFLKHDQIVAKLRRVWDREKRLNGGGCSAQKPSWTMSSGHKLAKKRATERLNQENERCKETVKMAYPRLPLGLHCPPNHSHENIAQKHQILRTPPLSTHPGHFTGDLPATSTTSSLQSSSQEASQHTSNSDNTGLSQDSQMGSLCDMFSPAAAAISTLPSDNGDGKYCLFVNEADIFM